VALDEIKVVRELVREHGLAATARQLDMPRGSLASALAGGAREGTMALLRERVRERIVALPESGPPPRNAA
jgi:hypothetical protein